MSEISNTTQQIQERLDRWKTGDAQAREELIQHAYQRLTSLASKHLDKFPRLRSTEETGSVLHEILLKLGKTLDEVKPDTPRQFFKLASQKIHWLLLDLKKRAQRQKPLDFQGDDSASREPADSATGPATHAERDDERIKVLEKIETLPEELKEVFDLRYYQKLTVKETASLIGISESTVKRHWRDARLLLAREMGVGIEHLSEEQ